MLYCIVSPLIISGFAAILIRLRFDRFSIVVMIAAALLYYFQFYTTHWEAFALDPLSHVDYIHYVIEHHGALPRVEDNPASHHPPFYYYLCAAVYELAAYVGSPDAMQVVRHVSMTFFLMFITFGALTLRTMLPAHNASYYSALGLLVLWPIGITMGARISNDIMLYAGQMFVLYMLVRWCQSKDLAYMVGAFIGVAFCLLAKEIAIIMLGLCIISLLMYTPNAALVKRLRERVDLGIAVATCILCMSLTFYHGSVLHFHAIEHPSGLGYWWRALVTFNIDEFLWDTPSRNLSFWNMFLHSFVLGDVGPEWTTPFAIIGLNILFIIMVAYLLAGLYFIHSHWSHEAKTVTVLLLLFALSMLAAMMYMTVHIGFIEYADARFAYPLVTLFALSYGAVMERYRSSGYLVPYRLGIYVASGFMLLSVALILGEQLW